MLTEMPLRSVRDRMLVISALGASVGLDQEAMLLMAEHARPRVWNAGDVLIAEGEPTHEFHVVTSGRLVSHCKRRKLGISERGGSAGILGVLSRSQHGLRVVAEIDSMTLEIPGEVLLDAHEDNFSVLCAGLKSLAQLLLVARGPFAAPAPQAALEDASGRARTAVEMLIQLTAEPPFDACSIDSLADMVRSMRARHFAPGDVIMRRGERIGRWLGIHGGRLTCISAAGSETREAPLTLGMFEALAGEPASLEVRAETPIVAHEMDLESFLSVAESHFEFAREFVTLCSRQLLESMGTLEPE
jgi:CRP-like cAMP-binding protein